ncbi:MAG: glycosyltransferase [Prosthecobacter sp.]|nr:glycosyltransferase [Prosthecobacter sp.]
MPPALPCRLTFLIRDLGHGGAQRQLVTLTRALAAREDFSVSVVHFYPGPFEAELRTAGVKTVCIGKRHRWDLAGFFLRLVHAVRQLRPDVIHGYLHESNLMALFLKPLCGFPKVIWGIRDSRTDAATWGLLGKLSFRLNCLLSGFADLIIANSRAGRRYYIQQGYPEDSFAVVPNGIDVARFQPSLSFSDTHGCPSPRALTFALIGRLHPMKDHATFLRALALVPDAHGVIVGHGDAAYTDGMKKLAESLGITSRLEWRPAQDDLTHVYPSFDCLVSTSAYGEGFSNVIGEAMACGLPVIASDVGDSAWLLDDPLRVFPAGDYEALAVHMRLLLSMPQEERHDLGQRNRQRIVQHFTIERMVESTAAHCKRVRQKAAADSPLSSDCADQVLWLTTGLGTGGAEMMLTQIITGLTGRRVRQSPAADSPQSGDCTSRHHVISLTSGGKYMEPLRAAGAQVHSLDMPAGKPTLRALIRLFQLAWQIRPTLIMGWMYHGCLAAVLVKLFRLGQGRVIWNIRQSLYDLSLEKRGSARVIQSLKWAAPLAEVITYNSQLSARQHEAIGYTSTKTQLIPNGFDLEKWSPRLPISTSHRLQIGRFGRYAAMKDYPTFLEAAAIIAKTLPQAEFLLVGTGVDASNPELTQIIQRLGLQNHVHLLGERADIPELTASLDLAVSSSAFGEGFPNVVGEAMACGVPVVATDIGDTAWVMGETGTLVPAQDPTKLAEACLRLLQLPEAERRALGEKGRQRISEHFSLASVLARFDEVMRHDSP